MAAVTVMLVGVVVLGGSVWALREGRGGYPAGNLAQATVDFGAWGGGAPIPHDQRVALLDRVADRAGALRGVEAVAYAEALPDERGGRSGAFARSEGAESGYLDRRISPGLLGVLGMPPVAGRGLLPSDRPPSEPVAVVDQSFADHFVGTSPVEQLVAMTGGSFRVVGVVDSLLTFPLRPTRPTIYTPFARTPLFLPYPKAEVVARFRRAPTPGDLVALGRAVRETDPSLRVLRVETVRERRSRMLGTSVPGSFVLVVFALGGLLLTLVGAIGLTTEDVARDAPGLAIRAALGAEPGDLQWEVSRRMAKAAGLGVAVGLAGGFVFTRIVVNRIPWVESPDPVVFLAPAAALGLLLIVAGALAARRVLRVEPWQLLAAD